MPRDTAFDPRERPSSVPWPPMLLAGVLAGGWLMGRLRPVPWPGLDDLPARLIGIGAGVAGLVLVTWAIATLRQNQTTVMPDKRADHLVTSGPYAWSRNPIYLAEVLMLLGIAEITKNIWFVPLAFLFALLVSRLAIVREERHLEARFGEDWRTFAGKTRRWL